MRRFEGPPRYEQSPEKKNGLPPLEKGATFERREAWNKDERPPADSRYSLNEALLYQTYASEFGGTEWSEKPDIDAGIEAGMIISYLKHDMVDLGRINWETLDFSKALKIKDIVKREEAVVRVVRDNVYGK